MAGALWTIDDIRQELEKLESSASFQKPDFYRVFTRRLKEIFSSFKVLKGDETIREVDVIYANPERAVAKIVEGKTQNLPLLSLQLDGVSVDERRQKPMEALVERKFWIPEKQRAIRYMALAPVAANLAFVLNIWGKYVEEVNQLTEQIMLQFRPNLRVDIREDEVYQAYLKDVSDSSNMAVGDRQDRIIKRQVRFEVQSYIPSKVFRFTNTGEIQVMTFEVYLDETSGLVPLESYIAGGGKDFLLNQVPNRGAGITTVQDS
jgi:hypothetical protein